MRTILVSAILSFVTASSTYAATSSTARMRAIVDESVGLWLTEDMHSEFWALLESEVPDRPQRAEVVSFLKEASEKMLPWQKAMYESFLLSYKTGKAQWTEEYLEQVDYWRKSNAANVETAEAMNRAAATKTPMVTGEGEFFVTEELILGVLENVEVSKFRAERLFNESWDPKPVLFEYPKLGLSLVWDEPWTSSTSVLKLDGAPLTHNLINLEKPNGDGWQIVMSQYPSPASKPLINQRRTLEGAAKSLGIQEHLQYEQDWKGLESSIQTGTLEVDGEDYLVKNSATYIPGLQVMMQRMVWSLSPATTQAEFQRLSESVMFLDEKYAVSAKTQEDRAKQEQFNEALEKEMRESGAGEEAINAMKSAAGNIPESEGADNLKAAYGDLWKLTDREIAVELSLDPSRKARIGLAHADLVKAEVTVPMYLDEDTSYTGVHYDIDAGSLVYHYTMPSETADMIMSMTSDERLRMRTALEDGNANAACELSLELLAQGFDMTYSYRNPSGKELFNVVRSYSDCVAQGY